MSATQLHPDLEPWVFDTSMGRMLKHPLVFQLGIDAPTIVETVNEHYEAKKQALKDAAKEGNWFRFVILHERPYRIEALEMVPRSAEDYWTLVRDAWMDTEFPSQMMDNWIDILDHPDAHQMMDDEERAVFDALPDLITVFRGYEGEGEDGLSWTLSRERAEWFAARWQGIHGEPQVVERLVPKTRVVAYLNGRSEQEVIVLPKQERG